MKKYGIYIWLAYLSGTLVEQIGTTPDAAPLTLLGFLGVMVIFLVTAILGWESGRAHALKTTIKTTVSGASAKREPKP